MAIELRRDDKGQKQSNISEKLKKTEVITHFSVTQDRKRRLV